MRYPFAVKRLSMTTVNPWGVDNSLERARSHWFSSIAAQHI